MTVVDQIRANRRKEPFRPFALHMKGGEVITVPSQEYVLTPPQGNQIIVVSGRSFRMLDYRYIESVSFADQNASAKAS